MNVIGRNHVTDNHFSLGISNCGEDFQGLYISSTIEYLKVEYRHKFLIDLLYNSKISDTWISIFEIY